MFTSFIHSFIHLENLYSAPSRKLLRGASSPSTVKKISFKQLVEQRRVAVVILPRSQLGLVKTTIGDQDIIRPILFSVITPCTYPRHYPRPSPHRIFPRTLPHAINAPGSRALPPRVNPRNLCVYNVYYYVCI